MRSVIFVLTLIFAARPEISVSAPAADAAARLPEQQRVFFSNQGEGRRPSGPGVLKGRVLDAQTGEPVRRALVELSTGGADHLPSTFSDDEGRWEIAALPLRRYFVGAIKAGYATAMDISRGVSLTEGQPTGTIDIRLNRGAVLSGRIVDATGEPAAQVGVAARTFRYLGPNSRQWIDVGSDQTDDRGHFRIYGLGPGDFVLVAHPDGRYSRVGDGRKTEVTTYYPGTPRLEEAQRFTLGPAVEYSDLTFSLQTANSVFVRGRVITSGGPLNSAFVELLPDTDDGMSFMGSHLSAGTEPDGRFVVQGVTSGRYLLHVTAQLDGGKREIGRSAIEVAEEDVTGVSVITAGPTLLRGRVVPSRAGITMPAILRLGAQPVGTRMIPFGGTPSTTVGKDGTFELEAYEGPVKIIQAMQLDGWRIGAVRLLGSDVTGGIPLTPGENVEGIEVVLLRVASHLTGAVTGIEVVSDQEGVVVLMRGATEVNSPIAATVPIHDGRFNIGPLPAGDYDIVAVTRFSREMLGQPEQLELLRARATRVSLRENEQKVVNLTLITGR